MNQKCTTWATLAASIFVGGVMATDAQGQTSDALLNTLIKKGIISEQEAKEIKTEASKETAKQVGQTFSEKTGMPSWITSYRLYGDFRGRFEENYADNSLYNARERYRLRLRLGLNVSMLDGFDVGLRLATGNPQTKPSGVLAGGQSITANQDFNSLETRKFIWLDAAYARWTPIKNDRWTVAGTIGKMDNPFQLSNMVWDYDINPEGGALQITYNISDHHALKGIGAGFILDEINAGTPGTPIVVGTTTVHPGHDPYLYGGQVLLESKWTPQIESSVGIAALDIVHRDSLSTKLQPFYNAGNTRTLDGFLLYNFNPIIGSASATYKIPVSQTTTFPIKLAGEYMENPTAPSDRNVGYRVGATLGKAGRKNTWEINYRYQHLEADAWFDAMVDDDNGAFYAPGHPQIAFAGPAADGWFGGTNVRGHQVVATYSFTDFVNLTVIYYLNEAIINQPGQSSKAGHFMVETNLKF